MAMSTYVFLCEDCNKEFSRILHIADVYGAVAMNKTMFIECPTAS
ncbi:MAG TPA: hypothetical protein VH308_01530 [Terracidiphilus sp.]|nr:hypothetical protein [Terracidiphilus sp.]